MKWFLFPLFVVLLFSMQTASASALAATKLKVTAKPKTSPSSISVNAQYLKTRNTVRATFSNFKGVKTVSYTLMYQGNGIGQGVMGSFVPGKKTSVSQNLYLGTCSGKVCTPHRNVKNIQLDTTTTYTNGKSSTKTVKVK